MLEHSTDPDDMPLLLHRELDFASWLSIDDGAVVFLDVDGVINSGRWLHTPRHRESRCDRMVREIDPVGVGYLNQLLDRSGAKVVISSSWRMMANGDHKLFEEELRHRGFIGEVIGLTPIIGYPRGNEIQAWIDATEFAGQFVILDDMDDMLHLTPWLVRTDPRVGIQQPDVDRALEILQRKPRER